ncbi:MAG: hypothetical protein ACP5OG_02890 [Candidatus Nanoarchaeia archaeon]
MARVDYYRVMSKQERAIRKEFTRFGKKYKQLVDVIIGVGTNNTTEYLEQKYVVVHMDEITPDMKKDIEFLQSKLSLPLETLDINEYNQAHKNPKTIPFCIANIYYP